MLQKFVSTPSRICLFGEHQDYLGLEVIALAVDLRFRAKVKPREDQLINIQIRESSIGRLGQENVNGLYEHYVFDLTQPLTYENNRDYLKSVINVLRKNGYAIERGLDIVMDSTIPIGKGMCSSSTMIIALIKAVLEAIESPDKDKPETIAYLGYLAEVAEFKEPGGMMDHYASSLGGLVHLDFQGNQTWVEQLTVTIPECFILFDSLETKDTTKILAASKVPTLEALDALKPFGVQGIADFLESPALLEQVDRLDELHRRKLFANIDNYRILKEALTMLKKGDYRPEKLGKLITRHHENLRDGLGISTPAIETILNAAFSAGALGGKVNGSGGGGCLYVYAKEGDAQGILEAVEKLGYPGKVLHQDQGVCLDRAVEEE